MRYRFGGFVVDDGEGTVTVGETRVVLTHKTFNTLRFLVQNPGRLVTREELIEAVWPDAIVEEGNLHWTVSALRKALVPFDSTPVVETVRGRGYRFLREVEILPDREAVLGSTASAPLQDDVSVEVAPPPAISERPRLRPRVWIAASALLAVAVALPLALLGLRERRPWLATYDGSRPAVAVLGFHDVVGRPDTAWIGPALTEMISADLTARRSLRAVPREDVARVRRDLGIEHADTLSRDTLLRIRRQVGPDLVVVGSYVVLSGGDERLRVDIHVQETEGGRDLAAVSRTGRTNDLFEMVAVLSESVRSRIGLEGRSGAEASAMTSSLPASIDAARNYAQGLDELRRHRWKEALPLLEKAVAGAPDMAMVQRALSEAALLTGNQKRAEEAAFAALQASSSLRPSERLTIEAHYRLATRDWVRAVPAYRALLEVQPESVETRLELVKALQQARRADEAMKELEGLRALPGETGKDPRIDLTAAWLHDKRGEPEKALEAAERALTTARALGASSLVQRARIHEIGALKDLGRLAEGMKVLAEARKALEGGSGDGVLAADLLTGEGGLLLWGGDLEGARRAFLAALEAERALGRVTSIPTILFNLSIVAHGQGDLDEEERLLREGLIACGPAGRLTGREFAYPSLSAIARLRGDLVEAERIAREALRLCEETKNRTRERDALHELSVVMFERGRADESVAYRRRALKVYEGIGDAIGTAGERSRLAELLADLGRHREAAPLTEEVFASLGSIPGVPSFLEADLRVTRSRCLLAGHSDAGTAGRALREVEQAAKIIPEPKANRGSWLYIRFGLARARAATGDKDGARKALDEVLAFSDRVRLVDMSLRARLWLSRLDAAEGDRTAAAARLGDVRREAVAKGFVAIEREASSPGTGLDFMGSRLPS